MRAHKPLHDLLLLAAGVSLLASASAQAQRRVVLPPGVKPAPTEAAPPRTEPAVKAAPAGEEEDERAAPARKPTVSPAQPAAQPAPEAEPEKPRILLPDDLAPARPAEAKTAVAPAPSREVLYRKKVEKAQVSLRVRPAKPAPRRPATLIFEIVELLAIPDPAVGDRRPVAGGTFFAKVSLDGKSSRRYRLHPLKNAGAYGTQVTVPEPGVYRVALSQHLETREIGVDPIATEFLVGFGKETPMEQANDEEEDDAVQVRRGRRALRATRASAAPAPDLMAELGERWMLLETSLADERAASGEREEHAKAVAELSARVQGHVPATRQAEALEYDAIAAGLAPLAELPAQIAEPAAARETLRKAALVSCNRCHVKFRFGLADDLGRWPEFAPKAP